MTPARWTFLVFFGIGLLSGLWVGISELVNPAGTSVTLNGQDVTGMSGFLTALIIALVLWSIFGLIVAGIVALFTRKKKTAA